MHTSHSFNYSASHGGVNKRRLSVLFFALTVFFALIAVICLLTKGIARSTIYKNYLQQAALEYQQNEAESGYLRAVSLCPSKVQAYADLLSVYLNSKEKEEDFDLSESEYKVMATLLGTNEPALLRADPTAYADNVLFPLANALFFSYEDEGKALAADLLAKTSKYTADENRGHFAEALKNTAEYCVKINNKTTVDYEGYYDSLLDLCETDLIIQGAADDILPTCRFIIGELENGAFNGSDVSAESLQLLRDSVKACLLKVRTEGDEPADLLKRCDMLQFGASKEGTHE